ncbi:hypothetical protein PCE1_002114 [Barthelona sp. PCE]
MAPTFNVQPHKLTFKAHASSSDDPYIAANLDSTSQSRRGWKSERYAKHPHTLYLVFDEPVFVEKFDFLSHEHAISAKVDVFLGKPKRKSISYENANYDHLGFFTLASNSGIDSNIRPLRSVVVRQSLRVLKLVLNEHHHHTQNMFDQVGVKRIDVEGWTVKEKVEMNRLLEAPKENIRKASEANERGSLRYDHVTATQIKNLLVRKQQAVDDENYMEAKRLKLEIERLHEVGKQISVLEEEKKAAVMMEDYDRAHDLKKRIERMRNMPGVGAQRSEAEELAMRLKEAEDELRRKERELIEKDKELKTRRAAVDERPIQPARERTPSPAPEPVRYAPKEEEEEHEDPLINQVPEVSRPVGTPDKQAIRPMDPKKYEKYFGGPMDTPVSNPDDRPIKPKDTSPDRGFKSVSNYDDLDAYQGQYEVEKVNEPPKSIPAKYSEIAGQISSLFGDLFARSLFSTNFKHRETCIATLNERIHDTINESDSDVWFSVFEHLVKDKNPAIISKFGDLVPHLLHAQKYSPPLKKSELAHRMSNIIGGVLNRLTETNTRVRNIMNDLAAQFADALGIHLIWDSLLKKIPVKNTKAWLYRLQLLHKVLVKSIDSIDNNKCMNLMQFIKVAFESSKHEVRQLTIDITSLVYEHHGPGSVRASLPAFDNISDLPAFYKSLLDHIAQVNQKNGWMMLGSDPLQAWGGNQGTSQHKSPGARRKPQRHEVEESINNIKPAFDEDSVVRHDTIEDSDYHGARNATSIDIDPEDALQYTGNLHDTAREGANIPANECFFCGLKHETPGLVDVHWYQECPYLCVCPHPDCPHQVLPIDELNDHLLMSHPEDYVECPRCRDVVDAAIIDKHLEWGGCGDPPNDDQTRCPLCHKNVNLEEWGDHVEVICPRNQSRQKKFSKKLEEMGVD